MDLNTSVSQLKGVGEKSYELYKKLGLFTLDDLIHYYPRSYDKYETIVLLKDAIQNSRNVIMATVKSNPKVLRFNGKSIVSFFVSDESGTCEVRFYNSPFMAKAFKIGDRKVFRGYLKPFKDKLVIEQPKTFNYEDYLNLQNKIFPIYSLIKDLSNERLKKSVQQVISNCNIASEYLYADELKDLTMLPMDKALANIHFPDNEEALYLSRRRIIFEEFLQFYRATKEDENVNKIIPNHHKMIEVSDCTRLMESLPYELTNAQKRTVNEIFNDMSSEYTMNRLVQGDVGSGKTIVAFLAMLMSAANGYQSAMMAPTEVLSRQHFEKIVSLTSKYNLCIKPVLLTGKMSASEKKKAYASIESGEANVIIGTHALIQANAVYNNLALVITDEQHRFGVEQREKFKEKGNEPHLLVMSATPIPRTLALIVFAGLSVSVIDELPKNRIPILNCVVNSSYREKVYSKIRDEIDKGHQAYVICPMISETEEDELGLKSVTQYSKDIKEWFGEGVNVGSLTGKMKPDEKSKIMEHFKNRDIDILVSTTVIEVGIDVPNATIILIENAERFGLSQLHQLRGRVGRGNAESFCVLLTDAKNKETLKRLNVLNETNDGFKIAEEDMKLRGPGELNGVRQSGELQFGLGDINEDGDILLLVSKYYEKIKDRMPSMNTKLIDFRSI